MKRRVGCILSANENEVNLIGYGEYVGDEVPHENVGGFGRILNKMEVKNPKIILDSGKDVFGCECWWGDEDKIRESIGKRKVVNIDIDEVRSRVDASRDPE